MRKTQVEEPQTNESKKTVIVHNSFTVVGTVLCIILIPILFINISLIVKSFTDPDSVPSVGGFLPLVVLTDSMNPEIQSGDLVICHTVAAENVSEGDVIAFFDPASDSNSVVVHRVAEVITEDGALSFRTKGDANDTEDSDLVPAKKLVGMYRTRISGVGNVVLFLQTTTGLIVCVVLPLILLISYDIIRRRLYDRKQKQETDALIAELEALRKEKSDSQKKVTVPADDDE